MRNSSRNCEHGNEEKIAHRFSQTILFRLLCSNQIRVIRVIRGLFFFLVSNDKSGLKLKSVIIYSDKGCKPNAYWRQNTIFPVFGRCVRKIKYLWRNT